MSLPNEFQNLLTEYRRPWKLSSLFVGVTLLLAGAVFYKAPDWDIAISFIMATCTYLTASWSLRIIVERKWRFIPLMLFFTWFSVDGCYWIYWSFVNPEALEFMRDANFLASLVLYITCGLVWYYHGSLKELSIDTKNLFRFSK